MANVKPKKVKKKNRRKQIIKKHVIEVLVLSFIIFTIIFIIYKVAKLAIKPTGSFIIEQGKIAQKETLTGYVIRDEKVIQTPEDTQKVVQIKNEGERVSVGEAVFRYEAANEQELNAKIDELNIQIQEALEGQTEIFSSDIKALDTQIEYKLDNMKSKNNIKDIKEYKKDIDGYIAKKAKISGSLSPAGSYINNLINEKTSIENELKKSSR